MTTPAISCSRVTRTFGSQVALRDVTFSVERGQFFGFLGTNGAGKSTAIKILTGLLEASSGEVKLLGEVLTPDNTALKSRIGVMPEGMALLGRLTAPEYLRFVGRMYGLQERVISDRTNELIDFMGLSNESRKQIAVYSHGMQKKLAIAAAVIHGPTILFLDEPFEGVDVIAATTIKTMLERMVHNGTTIFLTSHILEIVERLSTHIAIIDKGTIVASGAIDEVCSTATGPEFITLDGKLKAHQPRLEELFFRLVGTPPGRESGQGLSWLG